jgi:hypothetical protein
MSEKTQLISKNIFNSTVLYSIKIGLVVYIIGFNKTSVLINNPFIRLIIISLIILFSIYDPIISLLGMIAFIISVQ